jgi:hypothetical protein
MSPALKNPLVVIATLGVLGLAGAALAAPTATTTHHHRHHIATYAQIKAETIDERIATLHADLKITPDEEANWQVVADTMRANEAAMQKLVADNKATMRQGQVVSAVDDLKTYEKFNQAHVDGLKDLITSFQTLYVAMPVDQRILADSVFQKFNRGGMRASA